MDAHGKITFRRKKRNTLPDRNIYPSSLRFKKKSCACAKRGEGGGEKKEWIFPRGESSPIATLNRKLSRGGDPDGAVLSRNKAELRPIGLQSRQTFSAILLPETTLRCAFEASRACYYD